MSDRERRVRADWAGIQGAGRDLEKLAELLQLDRASLEAQLEPLKLSVENGCLEYKRAVINRVFRELENERYKSLPAAKLDAITRDLGVLVYVASVQRLIADGHLRLSAQPARQEEDQPQPPESSTADVKKIIAEIQQRVKDEPELRTRQPVKNILMQLSRYTREMNEFKELTSRIPKEKAGGVAANFRKTTDEIFASIRRNYDQLLSEEQEAVPTVPQNILQRIDLKSLSPVYLRQAKEAAAVRSALTHAREEQYGTREVLIELSRRHSESEKLVALEEQQYQQLGGTPTVAREIARAFSSEIGKRIQREVEYF